MSILQEYQSHNKIIGDYKMRKLDEYLRKTGLNYDFVIYSRSEWHKFENWLNNNR